MISLVILSIREVFNNSRYRKFKKSLDRGRIITVRIVKSDPWSSDTLRCYQIDDIMNGYMRYHDIEDRFADPYYRACKIKDFWRLNKDNIIGF